MVDIDAVHRAGRARQILDDDMIQAAFEVIENGTIEEMLAPNITDDMRRQKADRVNAIRAVRQQFRDIIAEAEAKAQPEIRAP